MHTVHLLAFCILQS